MRLSWTEFTGMEDFKYLWIVFMSEEKSRRLTGGLVCLQWCGFYCSEIIRQDSLLTSHSVFPSSPMVMNYGEDQDCE